MNVNQKADSAPQVSPRKRGGKRRGAGRPLGAKSLPLKSPIDLVPTHKAFEISARGRNQLEARYRAAVELSAQQHAESEARKHAHVAGEMIRDCIEDMSRVLSSLREKIPGADIGELRTLTETYSAAIRELRRALGIVDASAIAPPSALVQVHCVGQASVSVSEIDPFADEPQPIPIPDVVSEFSTPLHNR